MGTKKFITSIVLLTAMYFLFVGFNIPVQEKWVAPTSADNLVNPLKGNTASAESGKKLYKVLCLVCHGPKGKGDGMAGAGLTPKPANLSSGEVQSQTDGAIFWKIENGRTPMPSYSTSIPEQKRWEIINYIRTLK